MYKSHRVLAVAVTLTMLCLFGATAFADELTEPNDLKDYQCRDVMILSGEDREIAIALAHGYMLGKRNTTKFIPEKLAVATDNFMNYCLDNPHDNALAVFEKFTK